jgi:hypothetical protein
VIRLPVRIACCLLTVALGGLLPSRPAAQTASTPDLQAAFLLNFARFTEWPVPAARLPLVFCVFGADRVGDALETALRSQTIGGRRLSLARLEPSASVTHCQVLFVGRDASGRGLPLLERASGHPILTVSDRAGFAQTAGIVELFVEHGRMRFAVNIDAAERSRLTLSSRLLGLAKIVRGLHEF